MRSSTGRRWSSGTSSHLVAYTQDIDPWGAFGSVYCNLLTSLVDNGSWLDNFEDRFTDITEETELSMTRYQLAARDLRAVFRGSSCATAMLGVLACGPIDDPAVEEASGASSTSDATSTATASLSMSGPADGSETTDGGGTSTTTAMASESTTKAGPCAEVWEGDLGVCMENCLDTATSDVDLVRGIRRITGRLAIVRSDLVDLGAFECLEEVGGLKFAQNDALESLAGLEQLQTIGADLPEDEPSRISVRENPVLESLAGLQSLVQVDMLFVNDNALLTSVGVPQLEELGGVYLGACGQISSTGSTALGDNPSLTALSGFDSLTTLDHVGIAGQNSLTSLDYLVDLVDSGVSITTADFRLNENLDIVEIEAFMAASGATGDVCGNAGDEVVCMCPIDD